MAFVREHVEANKPEFEKRQKDVTSFVIYFMIRTDIFQQQWHKIYLLRTNTGH